MNKAIIFGYHDRESPRTRTVRAELARRGWEVVECHAARHGLTPKLRDLLARWRKAREGAGAMLVTFPGQYLVPLAWLLTRTPRRRLMFDAFVSLYDSIVSDRGLVSSWHPYAWFLWLTDWISCRLADEVWVDTEANRRFFIRTFGIKPERIAVVYLEARADLFTPVSAETYSDKLQTHQHFNILFYGSFIPLQGVEHILDAAKIVAEGDPSVRFTLVGAGQTLPAMRAKAAALGLRNVEFRPHVALGELPDLIRSADLCLGIFGTSGKAGRVIPHKVCDAIACGVPVLTADTPAIRERFAKHPLVILCGAGNPRAIAEAVLLRSRG